MKSNDPSKSLGQTLTGEEERDAIHVAILPCICEDDWLSPGQAVELVIGTHDRICATRNDRPGLGIVDPFLTDSVRQGDRVWVFLRPGTVTGMRHHWSHPDIPEPQDAEARVATQVYQKLQGPEYESKTWLQRFAQKWQFDYDEMVSTAAAGGGYIIASNDLGIPEEEIEEFWGHMEIFTGKKFSDAHRQGVGFSCSC